MGRQKIDVQNKLVKVLLKDALVVTAVFIGALILSYFIKVYYTPTDSMYSSIKVGDVVVAVHTNTIRRGDIVTFKNSHTEGMIFVKRVVGLPTDTVQMKEGVVFINREALYEPYLSSVEQVTTDEITLKENEYFVLGDNREVSKDSILIGPIKTEDIKHKFVYRILPIDRIGPIKAN